MIYITSDIHFGHDKPFLFRPRGFDNIHDHDETIIQNWNSVIGKHDVVYILGDIMLNNTPGGIAKLKRLNGQKYFIRGNHDTDFKTALYSKYGKVLGYSSVLKYHKYNFYLSHYPTVVGSLRDTASLHNCSINLCGHSHTKDPFYDWSRLQAPIYHCELDAHDNTPVLLDDIILDMQDHFYR